VPVPSAPVAERRFVPSASIIASVGSPKPVPTTLVKMIASPSGVHVGWTARSPGSVKCQGSNRPWSDV
jgi:hypothetical protein